MDENPEPVIMERILDSHQLVEQIRECLRYEDAKGLKTYILEHKLSDQTVFWELTSELTNYITEAILEKNPNFFEACERCLSYLVRNGNPKEMILALLEQADCENDDVKYESLLKLVQATLIKLPSKRFHSLDMALETLSAHVKSLELPEYTNLEAEEKHLLDSDVNVRRIGTVVSAYLDFFKPFVEEVSLNRASSTKQNNPQVVCLKKHLLFLLEHPLVFLNLEYNVKEDKAKSTSRCLAERAIDLLVKLERDFHKYLEFSRNHLKRRADLEDESDISLMEKENEENERRLENQNKEPSAGVDKEESWKYEKHVPELSQACLSYLMHVEHLGLDRLPSIYKHSYILEFNLPFISLFLKKQEALIILKGLLLLQSFMDIVKQGSLTAEVLDNRAYINVASDVVGVMIHCPAKDLRQMCVTLLPAFIKCFNAEGRYKLLQMILASCDHSGVQGFLTQMLKDEISDSLSSGQPEKTFIGPSLDKIIRLLMKLQDGPATDMLEISDRVISVLNLLRFLIIRDKPDANVTGIWSNFQSYESLFLDPIRTGLDMSKAHYKLELNKVLEGKDLLPVMEEDMDFSVAVGGQSLSTMPREQRVNVLQSALVTFDMIESLHARLLELKDQIKSGSLKRFTILSSRKYSYNSSQGETTDQHKTESFADNDGNSDKYEDDDYQLKQRILTAAVNFVPEHGWTRKTLAAGAEAESLPPIAHGMFPRGGTELIHHFYTQSNKQLAETLEEEVEELKKQGLEKPDTRPFIASAIQTRLRMITPYIEQWPQAMAIQTLPQNAMESWRNLASLADDIWFYAGDRSTDFNWYTKRASLAAVYKSTEIYMVQDQSEDFTDTWVFLDRRLDNLTTFGKTVKNMEQTGAAFGESLLGMCIVGRNILGMNSRKR